MILPPLVEVVENHDSTVKFLGSEKAWVLATVSLTPSKDAPNPSSPVTGDAAPGEAPSRYSPVFPLPLASPATGPAASSRRQNRVGSSCQTAVP